MFKFIGIFMIGLLTLLHGEEPKAIRIFLAGDSTMSIKETRAYPETGWGMPFVYFWKENAEVVNLARNGRSTKTFIAEGLWQSLSDQIQPGDYVFIQFGHNDEVPTKRSFTTPDSFAHNLERFVEETRAKKAKPVLLTPVARRSFNAAGVLEDTHAVYSAIIKQVAHNLQVRLIDLNSLSQELFLSLGEENSKWLFLHLTPGEHPNYPEGKTDNTHFSELGARLVAQMVLLQIKQQIPELAPYIVNSNK